MLGRPYCFDMRLVGITFSERSRDACGGIELRSNFHFPIRRSAELISAQFAPERSSQNFAKKLKTQRDEYSVLIMYPASNSTRSLAAKKVCESLKFLIPVKVCSAFPAVVVSIFAGMVCAQASERAHILRREYRLAGLRVNGCCPECISSNDF